MRPAARAQRVGGPRFAPLIHCHSVLLTVVLQWVNIRIAKEISWIPLFGDALTVLVGKIILPFAQNDCCYANYSDNSRLETR